MSVRPSRRRSMGRLYGRTPLSVNPRYPARREETSMIERRPFGRTGHLSSATLFGAAALAQASQADADRALEVLLKYGVNHIDTAARYGDSELRIGPWMARHRKDFFLATKTGMRTGREAREDIHRSLERLRVDHVDLIQLHSLGHPDDWDQAMGPGGALAGLGPRPRGRTRRGTSRSRSGPTSTGQFTGPSVCPASSSIRPETWRCFPRCWTPRAASSAVPRTTRWRRCSTRRG